MNTIQENAGQENAGHVYVKPATKKHDAVNTVQGSWLYAEYTYTYYYTTYYYY